MTERATLSTEEFSQFCDFFYKKTGIRFGAQKRYFVDKRILDRMKASKSRCFHSYLRDLRLETDARELQTLIDAMTVNETYFFRETEQLDTMISTLLPEAVQGRPQGSTVRIWSMPCSTGEEPYGIAIKLLEDWDAVDRFDISIFGSDIDSQVIQRARKGIYSARSVDKIPSEVRKRYFRTLPDGSHQIIEELRESIDFQKANALDRRAMGRFIDMDFVFCRNMLIYFDDVSRRKTLDAIYDALRPGGHLFLGASESMGRSTNLFEVRKIDGRVAYRKPIGERERQ